MKIVIPTAGYGTRLRPQTWSKPKPLVPVAGKAVLGHVLDMFESLSNVEEVIFIIGYLGDQIEAYVKEAYPDLPIRSVVQKELIGQSHAIWLAREHLSGPMMMAFVDTIIEADLNSVQNEQAEAVGWVKEVPDPRRFGVAAVDDQGWVQHMVEKPQELSNNLALVGFYYFQQAEDLIAAIETQMEHKEQLKGEFFLVDAINIMLEAGLKMRVETIEEWHDCGKPDALLETNRYLLENGRDNMDSASQMEGTVIVPPVFIDPSAEIRESVIGPHVSIGAKCRIEQSKIKDSIIDSGSRIVDASISESIIGRHTQVQGHFRGLNIGDTAVVRTR